MSAFYGAGIAQGAANVAEYGRNWDMRQEQLKEAKARRQMAEGQLAEQQAMAPAKQSQAELMAYQANNQLLRSQTFDAIQRYDSDGEPRHLNMFLESARTNPVGSKLYGDIVRFDRLGGVQRSPEIDSILKQAGYADPQDAYDENNPNMVLATGPDGKYTLMDLDRLKGVTGYNKYATNEQLAKQEQQARINQMLRGGASYAKVNQLEELAAKIKSENAELTTAQAYKQAKSILDTSGGTADERMITQIMQEQGIGALEAVTQYYGAKRQGTGMTNESQFIESYMQENPGASRTEAATAYANRGMTSAQKELGDIEETKTALKESGFFEKNISELTPVERADVHEKIAKIEDLRGIKLTTEDKRLARQFRDLAALGAKAGESITDAETGIVDTMLNSVNAYITNEVGGKEATSAYESFRNIYRNALYGASLTATEVQSFEKAVGSLKQQTKPVLAQLKTQMNSLKTQLESIRDTNDPYLAHYYFGSDIDGVDRVIESIEQRLNMFNTNVKGGDIKFKRISPADKIKETLSTAPPKEPGAPRPSLDEIFEGAN